MVEINENMLVDSFRAEDIIIYDFRYDNEEYKNCARFKVVGLPNWLFGAWLRSDNSIDCFVQHELFINKFKPSYGDFNINLHYYSEGYWSTFEVANMIHFIQKHEAIFFMCEDDITMVNGKSERWYKRKMKKRIKEELNYKKETKKLPKKLAFWFNIGASLGLLSAIYRPDRFNCKEYEHINDYWYVLPHNKLGVLFAKKLKKKIENYFVGCIWDYKNELEWKVAALECYLTGEGEETEEDILKECNEEIAEAIAAGELRLYE